MKKDPLPDALKPDSQCVRTHWNRDFMAFQLVRRTRVSTGCWDTGRVASSMPVVVTGAERASFPRCRRQRDCAAGVRRQLAPVGF
jgi:hypothetical protein